MVLAKCTQTQSRVALIVLPNEIKLKAKQKPKKAQKSPSKRAQTATFNPPDQTDSDGDDIGDACDAVADLEGPISTNVLAVPNPVSIGSPVTVTAIVDDTTTGDLNFRSSDYDWLVVAGTRAHFKGIGTLNGTGNFGFLLTVVDAALTPSIDVDLFRIKIWNKDNADTIIYDNNLGVAEIDDPATAIVCGSIMIHTPKGKK